MALLEEGVYHEPDLLPPDVDGWQEWGAAQLERIFAAGAMYSPEGMKRWLLRVEELTDFDASKVIEILERRAMHEVAVP